MNFKRYEDKQDTSSRFERSERNKRQMIKRNCITQTYLIEEDFVNETVRQSKIADYIGGATDQTLYMHEGQIAFTYTDDINNGKECVRTVLNGLKWNSGTISNKIKVEGIISYSVDPIQEREIGVINFGELSIKNTSDMTLTRGDKIRFICPPTSHLNQDGTTSIYSLQNWTKKYAKERAPKNKKIDGGEVKIELIIEKVDTNQIYKKMLNDSLFELATKGQDDTYFQNNTIKNDQYYSQIFCNFIDSVQKGNGEYAIDQIKDMSKDNDKKNTFREFIDYVKYCQEYHATVTIGGDKGDYICIKLNLC
jgi:hypothetical protein